MVEAWGRGRGGGGGEAGSSFTPSEALHAVNYICMSTREAAAACCCLVAHYGFLSGPVAQRLLAADYVFRDTVSLLVITDPVTQDSVLAAQLVVSLHGDAIKPGPALD